LIHNIVDTIAMIIYGHYYTHIDYFSILSHIDYNRWLHNNIIIIEDDAISHTLWFDIID